MLNRVATREEGIESPRPEGSILAEGSQPRPMGGSWILPELVVQTGAPDVVLQVDVAIRKSPTRAAYHARATGERVPVAEVNVEELALRGPAVTQCVFDATTDRPPLRVSDCRAPVFWGRLVSHCELSIFAHAPPPVTYSIVLGPNHQKLVRPSLPRAVTSQRSCSSKGRSPNVVVCAMAGNAWPDLFVAEPSPSMPKTHAPACQLQPSVPPPMKPDRLKSFDSWEPGTNPPVPGSVGPPFVTKPSVENWSTRPDPVRPRRK